MSKDIKNPDFPHYLYCGSDIADNSTTSEATGIVEPKAAYGKKDNCWIGDGAESERQQKEIIINTLSLKDNWKLFTKLSDAGFKIYLHNSNNGALEEFDASTYFDSTGQVISSYLKQSQINHENNLKIIASKEPYKITANHLFIIDESNLARLKYDMGLSEEKPDQVLKISLEQLCGNANRDPEDYGFPSFSQIHRIKTILQSKSPNIVLTRRSASKFSSEFIANIERIFGTQIEEADHAIIPTQDTQIIYSSNINDFFDLDSNSLVDHEKLEKITEIILNEETPQIGESTGNIPNLLKALPELKSINLQNLSNLSDGELDFSATTLDKVKIINLSGSTIYLENIFNLLEECPNAADLVLRRSILCSINSDLGDRKFPQVKTLMLFYSEISLENLSNLLQLFINAENIDLSSVGLYELEEFNLGDRKFPQVKILKLYSSYISPENLFILLKAYPNLENLNLGNCQNLADENLNFGDLVLNKLKTINLCNSFITLENFRDLSKACPNIENLKLNKGCVVSVKDIEFRTLKEVSLSGLNVLPQDLSELLKKNKNLETINLSQCNALSETLLNLEGANLDKLKEIDLSGSDISAQNLSILLKACPNLERIYLGSDKRLAYAELPLGDVQFKYLYNVIAPKGIVNQLQRRSDLAIDQHNYKEDEQETEFKSPPITSQQNPFANLSMIKPGQVRGRSGKMVADARIENTGQNALYEQENLFTPSPSTNRPQIGINAYRLEAFNQIETRNNELELKTNLQNSPPDPLLAKRVYNENLDQRFRFDTDIYKCQVKLKLDGEWTALPSLSTKDELLALQVVDINGNKLFPEIKYDEKTAFYYIKTSDKSEHIVDLKFLIAPHFDVTLSKKNVDQLKDEKLKSLIKKYQFFREGTAQDQAEIDKCHPKDVLKKIREMKVGSCRHRANAAFAEINEELSKGNIHGVECQIITNDNHSYIEVREQGGNLIKIDLGGVELKLANNGRVELKSAQQSAQLTQQIQQQQKQQAAKLQAQINAKKSLEKLCGPFASVWQEQTSPYQTIEAFNRELIINPKNTEKKIDVKDADIKEPSKKLLVSVNSDEELINYRRILLEQLAEAGNKVEYLYIDSPSELSLKTPNVEIDEKDHAVKKPEAESKLYKFITSEAKAGVKRVLIINWDKFSASDIVNFNTVLDQKRMLDGKKIAKDITVVGFHNKGKDTAYSGEDASSRYGTGNVKTPPTISENPDKLTKFTIKDRDEKAGTSSNTAIIDLHNSTNWRNILLHQFVMQGSDMKYEKGELVNAIEKVQTEIILRNAPWHNPEFTTFIDQLLINKSFEFYGKSYPMPPSFTFFKDSFDHRIEFNKKIANPKLILINQNPSPNSIKVNSTNCWKLLRSCNYDKTTKEFTVGQGIIKNAKDTTLDLFITSSLTSEQFFRILKEAQTHNVKLNLTVTKGIELPFDLDESFKYNPRNLILETKAESKAETVIANEQFIISKDIDFTVAKLKELHPNQIEINVSELEITNLFDSTKTDKQNDGLKFLKIEGLVNKLLEKEGKTVILKGHFSAAMADKISEISAQYPNLIIVTDKDEHFKFCHRANQNNISFEQKIALLKTKNPEFTEELVKKLATQLPKTNKNELSFVYLKSCLKYLAKNPTGHISDLRKGLEKIETKHDLSNHDIDALKLTNEENSDKFDEKRLAQIENIFSHSPQAFIAGKTGVGKSAFIKHVLAQKHEIYHQDKTNIEYLRKWQKAEIDPNNPDKKHILFIDEANLINTDYSIFEGIHDTPPTIVIGNEILPLKPHNVMVFAGNPKSYGDRKTPALLERHGGVTIFDEMPPEYIYHRILKPVLMTAEAKDGKNIDPEKIAKDILKIYQIIVNLSVSDTVLISPRELQMMALSAIRADNENPLRSIYFIAESVVPQDKKGQFNKEFERVFVKKIDFTLTDKQKEGLDSEKFILTESRHKAYAIVDDYLKIREEKIKYKGDVDAKKYGGLGGIVIEGEPGLGKSEFVKQILKKEGFIDSRKLDPKYYDKKPDKKLSDEEIERYKRERKIFVHIPASLPEDKKIKEMIAAANAGYMVLSDEINAQSRLESVFNDLLMGIDPVKKAEDGIGKLDHPGALFIYTQNPTYMEGRNATSLATERRTTKIEFTPYSEKEMEEIALKKANLRIEAQQVEGQPALPPITKLPEKTKIHIEQFTYSRKYAKENGLKLPVYRDFNEVANDNQKPAKKRKIDQKIVPASSPEKARVSKNNQELTKEVENKEKVDDPKTQKTPSVKLGVPNVIPLVGDQIIR